MKTKILLLFPVLFVAALVASIPFASAWAQERAVGQVDLSSLAESFTVTPKVNLNFGPAMMAGFAETVRGQNTEAAEVLSTIRGLRVMVFEDVDTSLVEGSVAEVAARLAADGWTPALEVRDTDARVDMFLIESGQFVKGLAVLVREGGGTAVFANVYGDIEPAVIGKLIAQGNALDGLDFGEIMGQFQSSEDSAGPQVSGGQP
ncbi:MAG: DUF4252 domain-containing protein [Wenzhouxiangellaceae bacterium]|nr:DUF4252 domain-containing protein [Wenzhouxiangellaceae bacterium]